MVRVRQAFTHLDLTCRRGDELPDDHPLVGLAPHLFELPDPSPAPSPDPSVRIRGPLVNPPTIKARGRGAKE